MPSRAPRLQFPDQVVTAVVVVHDGAAWLGDCLESLRAQRRRPQRLVVVDTGSVDGSAELARSLAEGVEVVQLDRDAGLGQAVAAGLAAADALPASRRRGPVTEWLWVVHDDCRPEPDALLELLAEASRSVSATVLGCKQIDLAGGHLLEMGMTVDGSGRRRSGVEPHEVDQGQHDELRDVLAVGTAGMLVRRDVWDRLGGLDRTWSFHGEDIDFGWRANAAGERVLVVPRAAVRHGFSLSSGARRTASSSGATRRRHELQVLWSNTGAGVLPVLLLRTVLGSLLVALARLTSGELRGARDEAGGVLTAVGHPSVVLAARRRRRPMRVRSHGELRPLLGRSSTQIRRDVAARLGQWHRAEATGDAPRGWRDRPLLWLSLALVAIALVADRGVLSGSLHGGQLLPAQGGASDLWSAYVAGWHGVGLGSTAPAPPWLAVLGAAAVVLFGKPWLVVAVLVLGAVPLAGWTAYGAGSGLTHSRWLRAWAAAAYALLPVGLGAVAGGRLDVVVVVIVLPLVARLLAFAVASPAAGRPRVVAAGLSLAVAAAFAPTLWPVAALCGLMVVAMASRPVGRGLGRLVLVLAVAFLVLLPWSWHVALHPALALRPLGPVDGFALPRAQDATDLLLLHPGGPAQPATWLTAGFVVAAVAALTRSSGRRVARAAFASYVVAVAAALALSRWHPPGAAADVRPWTGVPLAAAGLAALCCAVVAADRVRSVLASHSFGWRQVATSLISLAAVVATAGLAGSWLVRGVDGPLTGRSPQLLPAFAAATAGLPGSPRVLVLHARGGGVGYALVRSASGPRLGDPDLSARGDGSRSRAERRMDAAVAGLAGGDPQAAARLTELGVTQVADRAVDDRLLPGLSRVDGLTAVPSSGIVVRRTTASAGELVVLAPGPAAAALHGALPAGARPAPVPATAGRARTRIRSGPTGRLLVLAESADPHWRATLDGRPLTRSTAYGWAQAWRLPAEGGRLVVGRSGDRRGWTLLGELAVLVLLVLAARPVRRPSGRPA